MTRRLTAAEREARRVRRELKRNTEKARVRGTRMRHGIEASYGKGCRCTRCRIAHAKSTGRPCDPHWFPHPTRSGP